MRRRTPIRPFVSAAALALVLALGGCDGDGGGATPEVDAGGDSGGPDAVDTNWTEQMSLEQLIQIAEALGIQLVEEGESSEVSKEAVVDALQEQTGCGCFGAVCGTGYCEHDCGTCKSDKETCFAGTCETAASCPKVTPVAGTEEAFLRDDTESLKFRYRAELDGGDLERIRIFYNAKTGEALGPGTYDLRHHGLGDCMPCVAANAGCTDTECNFAFFARAGFVEIEAIEPDGEFSGRFHDLKFDGAYEDPKTGRFTILDQFEPKCVDEFAFETDLGFELVEPQDCDPQGNGTTVGSKLRDFELQNCNGDFVSFHQGCSSKAFWFIAVAGW